MKAVHKEYMLSSLTDTKNLLVKTEPIKLRTFLKNIKITNTRHAHITVMFKSFVL